jgi:Nucleotidyl transferase AbiEii toxin, Type IV TA system
MVPPGGVRSFLSFRSRWQRVHSAVDSCQVSWQEAHLFQKAGSGLRQRAQSGSSSVPPFSGAPVPQREQVAHRLRHRLQTGVPVAREIPILLSPADPQMLQARSGPGRQLWQTGPAPATAATRRSCPHFAQGLRRRDALDHAAFWLACPVMAFPLTMGITDPPVIALICLPLALLARGRRRLGRPAWRSDTALAAVVLGVACAMKYTAWPALAIIAVMVAARNGVRSAVRFTAIVLAAAGALVVALAPTALRHPASILQNTVAYPLGLTTAKSPAQSPLPGHLISTLGSGGRNACHPSGNRSGARLMPSPARDTAAGRIYNDLRNLARRTGTPTDQIMLEYLLERFLYRVSIHPLGQQHFVLKGGLLLAQFGARRVTRDIDILGRAFPGDDQEIIRRITQIARPKCAQLRTAGSR